MQYPADSGQPVVRYPWPQASFADAGQIAASFSSSSSGKAQKPRNMSIDLMATPELMGLTAQCLITTSGFGKKEDRDWHTSKLNINLTTQGFAMNLELE